MTRAQFLNDLYHRLEGLTQEQAEQHLTYYAEMLADRMEEGMSEEQAVESMEDVETIARRILEEEGRSAVSSRPPESPAYPDASRIPGGGGARAYQGKEKRDWRRPASILLWALAILCALGALGRWIARDRWGSRAADTTDVVLEESLPAQDQTAYDYGYEGDGFWVPLEGIRAVNVQMVTGAVWVSAGDGGGIFLRTDGDERLLHWEQNGNTLNISSRGGGDTLYMAVPDDVLDSLTINASPADVMIDTVNINTLDITTVTGDVRAGWVNAAEITVKTTSGDVYLDGLTTDSLNVSTASGDVELAGGFGAVKIGTASGNIDITGSVQELRCSSASGDVEADLQQMPVQMDVASKSGDCEITLPGGEGFALQFSTVSGELYSDFTLVGPIGKRSGEAIYLDGGGRTFRMSSISGDITLRQQ